MTVWLASYPKSGSTWMRAVATALRRGGPLDLDALDGGTLTAARAVLDAALGVPSSSLTADEVDALRPRVDELLDRERPSGHPHLRKVHDAFVLGPAGEPVVSPAAARAAVYLVRDPRDVALSYAHHAGRDAGWAVALLADPHAAMADTPGTLQRHVRQRLGTWSSHVLGWVDAAPLPVHVVRYEDCVADPVGTFAAALRFAGFGPVADDAVAAAVEHASFGRLRQAERRHGFSEVAPTARTFFRRGEAGAWRDELDPALAARVGRDHAEVMERFGYR